MFRNENEWIYQYKKKKAFWVTDENPKRPHALLTAGDHSGGFFFSKLVVEDETLRREAASDLLELFVQQGGDLSEVEVVVGPQTGATDLAESMAEKITALTGKVCHAVSPAKGEKDGEKVMVLNEEESRLIKGKKVLLCEDVFTTGKSVGLAADAVAAAGGTMLACILVLVNRSGQKQASGRKIIPLIDRHMPKWLSDDCPLCVAGSVAIRPKKPEENWELLTKDYG